MARATIRSRRAAVAASVIASATALAMVPPTAAAPARSVVRGGSGVVTTHGVGSQHFEVARPAGIRAFAGKPSSIEYLNKNGQLTGPRGARWEIWTYRSSTGGGGVEYSFHRSSGRWLFVQFDTNRKQFRTARGTRVGMTYKQAKTNEGGSYIQGCIDSGFWHFRDGHRYAVLVGVNPGQLVHALHAYGPGKLPC